jgi:hypothetical protein
MQSIILGVKATLALALCSAGWCLAADVNSSDVPAAPTEVAVSSFGIPLAAAQLEGYRGGFDVVKNDMLLSGSVANNSATDVLSGSNYIANGSFANASGVPMVVQNSGSNVLIQNATIINVQMK